MNAYSVEFGNLLKRVDPKLVTDYEKLNNVNLFEVNAGIKKTIVYSTLCTTVMLIMVIIAFLVLAVGIVNGSNVVQYLIITFAVLIVSVIVFMSLSDKEWRLERKLQDFVLTVKTVEYCADGQYIDAALINLLLVTCARKILYSEKIFDKTSHHGHEMVENIVSAGKDLLDKKAELKSMEALAYKFGITTGRGEIFGKAKEIMQSANDLGPNPR